MTMRSEWIIIKYEWNVLRLPDRLINISGNEIRFEVYCRASISEYVVSTFDLTIIIVIFTGYLQFRVFQWFVIETF